MIALRAAALLVCLAVTPAIAQNGEDLLLSGVTIVDTRDGRLLQNRTIHISKGRIAAIAGPGESVAVPSTPRIEAGGKFVVPGYLDMHAHPLMSADPTGSLALMLANGVTGFRQMAATPPMLEMRKAGKLPLSERTPELLAMSGVILTRGNAATPDAAIAEIRKQKAMGADFIKIVDIPRDAFFAALKEARAQGLPTIGHLQPDVNVVDAVKSGMGAIEHLGPRDAVLLGCSSAEAEIRQTISAGRSGPPPVFSPEQAAIAQRTIAAALANPMLLTPPGEFQRYQRVIDTYDEAKCRKLAELFVAEGLWQSPTLIRTRTMQRGDDPGYRNDANLKFMPSPTRKMWEELAGQFPAKITPEAVQTLRQLTQLQMRVVNLFDRAGARMVTGSDFGGQWIMPGFGLHQEFDLLAEAGLSPLSILQMTTLNGAKLLNREATMGTVDIGRDANLVLLDANPVADARNLHAIHAVVRAGVHYSAADLQRMKESVAVKQSATPSNP